MYKDKNTDYYFLLRAHLRHVHERALSDRNSISSMLVSMPNAFHILLTKVLTLDISLQTQLLEPSAPAVSALLNELVPTTENRGGDSSATHTSQ